jgi:hypothetical protein
VIILSVILEKTSSSNCSLRRPMATKWDRNYLVFPESQVFQASCSQCVSLQTLESNPEDLSGFSFLLEDGLCLKTTLIAGYYSSPHFPMKIFLYAKHTKIQGKTKA